MGFTQKDNPFTMIKLFNGPYNNIEIEDSGAVIIKMAIYDRQGPKLTKIGYAEYLPTAKREAAFWDGNAWLGELIIGDLDHG